MQLELNDIHIWTVSLALTSEALNDMRLLLNPQENQRAKRFHFAIHRERFIAARGSLRRILSLYLNIPPNEIVFAYDEHDKPSLANPNSSGIQFNLSHSENFALYALTLNHAIGIDIEKMRDDYHPQLAKRYYSQKENDELSELTEENARQAFFRIWSRKEAIIKAIGKGLSIPLSSFTVSTKNISEFITIENEQWSLHPLPQFEDYQGAFATNQIVKKIYFWKLYNQDYQLVNICIL